MSIFNNADILDTLPYGMYITADGTETLFDRSYIPMYSRDTNGDNVRPVEGLIENIVKHVWFYDDKNTPDISPEARDRSEKALAAFVIGDAVNDYVINERSEA